jgi:hypothetical protein
VLLRQLVSRLCPGIEVGRGCITLDGSGQGARLCDGKALGFASSAASFPAACRQAVYLGCLPRPQAQPAAPCDAPGRRSLPCACPCVFAARNLETASRAGLVSAPEPPPMPRRRGSKPTCGAGRSPRTMQHLRLARPPRGARHHRPTTAWARRSGCLEPGLSYTTTWHGWRRRRRGSARSCSG